MTLAQLRAARKLQHVIIAGGLRASLSACPASRKSLWRPHPPPQNMTHPLTSCSGRRPSVVCSTNILAAWQKATSCQRLDSLVPVGGGGRGTRDSSNPDANAGESPLGTGTAEIVAAQTLQVHQKNTFADLRRYHGSGTELAVPSSKL